MTQTINIKTVLKFGWYIEQEGSSVDLGTAVKEITQET